MRIRKRKILRRRRQHQFRILKSPAKVGRPLTTKTPVVPSKEEKGAYGFGNNFSRPLTCYPRGKVLSRYKPNNKGNVISHFGLNVNKLRITEVSDWSVSLFYHFKCLNNLVPKPKRNMGKRTFKYAGAIYFNSLPNCAKNATSVNSFKKMLTENFTL